MNIAKALDISQGRIPEAKPPDPKDGKLVALRLRHIEWLQLPETTRLINFISERRLQLLSEAENGTEQLNTDLKIRKSLSKATILKEVIEYARRDPTEQ